MCQEGLNARRAHGRIITHDHTSEKADFSHTCVRDRRQRPVAAIKLPIVKRFRKAAAKDPRVRSYTCERKVTTTGSGRSPPFESRQRREFLSGVVRG